MLSLLNLVRELGEKACSWFNIERVVWEIWLWAESWGKEWKKKERKAIRRWEKNKEKKLFVVLSFGAWWTYLTKFNCGGLCARMIVLQPHMVVAKKSYWIEQWTTQDSLISSPPSLLLYWLFFHHSPKYRGLIKKFLCTLLYLN